MEYRDKLEGRGAVGWRVSQSMGLASFSLRQRDVVLSPSLPLIVSPPRGGEFAGKDSEKVKRLKGEDLGFEVRP